jgi:hypothetical protein
MRPQQLENTKTNTKTEEDTRVHYTKLKKQPTHPRPPHTRSRPKAADQRKQPPPQQEPVSSGPNSAPEHKSQTKKPGTTRTQNHSSASTPTPPHTPAHNPTKKEAMTNTRERAGVHLRKEVIQPHLPVRLPCYDFVLIASPTFDHSPPPKRQVRPWASGVTDFHDVTGGVYKARERIHRSNADLRLLATPTS